MCVYLRASFLHVPRIIRICAIFEIAMSSRKIEQTNHEQHQNRSGQCVCVMHAVFFYLSIFLSISLSISHHTQTRIFRFFESQNLICFRARKFPIAFKLKFYAVSSENYACTLNLTVMLMNNYSEFCIHHFIYDYYYQRMMWRKEVFVDVQPKC